MRLQDLPPHKLKSGLKVKLKLLYENNTLYGTIVNVFDDTVDAQYAAPNQIVSIKWNNNIGNTRDDYYYIRNHDIEEELVYRVQRLGPCKKGTIK